MNVCRLQMLFFSFSLRLLQLHSISIDRGKFHLGQRPAVRCHPDPRGDIGPGTAASTQGGEICSPVGFFPEENNPVFPLGQGQSLL